MPYQIIHDMAILKVYNDIKNENDAFCFFGDEEAIMSAQRVSDFISSITSEDSEIDCKIHCRGGSVTEGYTIHDLIQNSGKTVKMTVEGLCASIATVILLAAKNENRSMFKNATILIHNPFIPEYTLADSYSAEDLAALSADLKSEEERLLNFYVEKTGADREVLAQMMKNETTLDATKAKEMGFISKIIEPIVAYKSSKNNFNQIISKMDAKKQKEFEDKLTAKSTLLDKILAKMGLKSINDTVLAMDITAGDGTVITVETDGAEIAEGMTASPDGTFVLPSGDTVVITGGKIESIQDATDDPMEMDALKKKCSDQEAEIAALKAEKVALTSENVVAKSSAEEAVALVKELQALKSSYIPEGRKDADPPQAKLTAGQQRLAKLREAQAKKEKF